MHNLPSYLGTGALLSRQRFFDGVLEPIYRDWFRTRVVGAGNIPTQGAALIVGNHAGAFAIDALMVVHALEGNSRRSLHLLGADFLFKRPNARVNGPAERAPGQFRERE